MSSAAVLAPVTHLQWSHWYRCDSNLDLSCVPDVAGIFVIARNDPQRSDFRVVHAEATYDLLKALKAAFAVGSPLSCEVRQAQRFLRYVPVAERTVREQVLLQIQNWIASDGAARPKSALIEEMLSPLVFAE